MLELGMATCCVLCDAPDEVGSKRCKACIAHHREMRERVASLPPESLAGQWAKQLLQMLARPSSYEYDEVHGDYMAAYASLLAGQSKQAKPMTPADVDAAFAAARGRERVNPIRDIANQSRWKNETPDETELAQFSEELPDDVVDESGVRTIPSKEIKRIDRSDRSGEDAELVARVQASAKAQGGDEQLSDLIVDLAVGEKRAERKAWSDLVGDIEELLDEEDL